MSAESLVESGAALRLPEVPRIIVGRGRVLYVGPGLDLRPHRNAAATVAIGLEAPFDLELIAPVAAASSPHTVALIEPGTMHHLRAHGAMAFLYLDGLGDDVEVLARGLSGGCVGQVAAAATHPGTRVLGAVVEALGLRDLQVSEALAPTVREIDQRPEDFPRLVDAAAHAGLSESRFRHVFREVVGMPFRRYRLWRRMAVVASELSHGRTLTQAALAAGFASSAHFSESFRKMFGMTASDLLRTGARFEFA
ncbi:MAG: helix-turn-helix transcriptional regulator [Nannocystales bacterium]